MQGGRRKMLRLYKRDINVETQYFASPDSILT